MNPTRFWAFKISAALLALGLTGAGDPPIPFENPSFEGQPKQSACPPGWEGHGPNNTPDTQPGAWEVQSPAAKDGLTYIGLVAREDGSRESIGQRIPQKLAAGKCYFFSVWLAHADHYAGYAMPIRLRVRGGSDRSHCSQVLGQSGLIDGAEWQEVRFQFTPEADMRYILLEADYAPGAMFQYRGNILLDNLSQIIRCDRA